MKDSKPLVIVLSRNYSTGLGMIRSIGEAGYTVDLIASVRKKGSSVIASSSRYVRNSTEVMADRIQGDKGEGIISKLLEYESDEKIILLPADDFTASVIDRNRTLLSEKFIMPGTETGDDCALIELMDKRLQGKLAVEAGLTIPKEWTVSIKGQPVIPEDMEYPCFVKPLQSITGSKEEMARCDNYGELMNHLKKMKQFYSNREVLIQEYLHIDKEYDLSGVCAGGKVIIPAVIEKTRIAQYEKGVTMAGTLRDKSVIKEQMKSIESMLLQLKYTGMFDMEFNLCEDTVYFNEINLRSGGPSYSYFLGGVNLPKLLIDALRGKEVEDNVSVKTGISFVYEKVAWEDYIHSYMTKKELMECISSADYTLLDNADDPMPGKVFRRRIRLSALKHRLKGRAGGR